METRCPRRTKSRRRLLRSSKHKCRIYIPKMRGHSTGRMATRPLDALKEASGGQTRDSLGRLAGGMSRARVPIRCWLAAGGKRIRTIGPPRTGADFSSDGRSESCRREWDQRFDSGFLQRRVCELSVPPETNDACSELFATSSFCPASRRDCPQRAAAGPGCWAYAPLRRAGASRRCDRSFFQ
jgi:hypothetical protein